MQIRFFFLFLFLITFFSKGIAQEMKITGTVFDSSGAKPLSQSLVMAVRVRDSILLNFTRTDKNGFFDLKNVPVDTFSLQILSPGYDVKKYYIFGSQTNKEISIAKIKLSIEAKELEDVVIYANKNPIYYKGDTLVYVADSFKVKENAVVEDLLKKLPGVKVDKDGAITSQGKEITQVLVDGDEFFGSDPTIATKNLAAKGVESVKVYEKKSETASAGNDATVQVMDLRLKADAKKGYFGKISAASDFQNFHEGELLLNKFNGSQKISVFALGSTTPRTNVSRVDMMKFGINDTRSNSTSGVPKTFSTGLFYSDKIGKRKKTKIGLNYSYNNFQLTSSTASRSKYSLQKDTSYYSDDSSHTIDLSEYHKMNFSLISELDSLTTLEIKPRLNVKSGTNENTNTSNYLSESEILSRSSLIKNNTSTNGISLDNTANLTHKFMKPKRQISLNYDLSISKDYSIGTLQSLNQFISVSGVDDSIDQQKINTSTAQNHNVKFEYVEPLTKKVTFTVEYLYEYGFSSQDKETKNSTNGNYNLIDALLTNKFENLKQSHAFKPVLTYESRTQSISGGLKVRNIDIDNQNLTSQTIIHQNISNLLPTIYYTFKPSQSKRFTVSYFTNSSQPSITALQLVQNNANTNRISIGNPDLKPNYKQTASIRINTWEALSGKYLWFGFTTDLTNKDFATSTNYDNYGRSISQTINVDGNLNSSFDVSTGIPLFKRRFEINPSFEASYSKYSNFVNSIRNTTINQMVTPGLELQLKLDSLDITVGGKYTYNNPKNSISSISTNPYSIQVYSANFNWTLPFKFEINSDFTYTLNGQRANGYNINYFVWNAMILKKFTKTDNIILSLNGYDILNQNISALRSVNGNVTTDNRTKIISRYFLVKLVYRFNNNKTKEEDPKRGKWH